MFEAYSVGVKISLLNGVGAGLLTMAAQFRGAGMEAEALNRKIAGIKRTLLIGGGLAAAGFGILAMFKPALDQAKQFQIEATKFSNYGMGDAMTAQAVKFAKGAKVIGASYVDMMGYVNEAQGVFRESGAMNPAQQFLGARIAAPVLAKLAFLESAMSSEQRGAAHGQDLAFLRFVEARGGANDPSTFAAIADWGYKLSKSSGGIVDWSQLQQFTATAGAAGFNLTQDAIAKLEPVLADMKGGRTGSGLRVSFQRMLGTQRGLPKQAVDEYLSLGLWDRSKVELSSGGGIKRFLGRPGEVLNDRDKLATDPVAYYEQNFLPAIAKKYGNQILGDTVGARTQRAAEISMVFGPGTAGALYSQIDKLLPAIHRSVAAQRKQLGIDDSAKGFGDTAVGQELRMQADYKNIMESTGEVVLPMVIAALKIINPQLEKFAAWSNAHPKGLGAIVDGLVALGAILAGAGSVLIIKGVADAFGLLFKVFGGPIGMFLLRGGLAVLVGGIELLGAGLAVMTAPVTLAVAGIALLGIALYEIVKHWDSSKSILENVKFEFALFFNWLINQARSLVGLPALAGPRDPSKPYGASAGWDGSVGGAHMASRNYVAPKGAGPALTNNFGLYIDGKYVGPVVAKHLASGFDSTTTGPARHDPMATLASPNWGH